MQNENINTVNPCMEVKGETTKTQPRKGGPKDMNRVPSGRQLPMANLPSTLTQVV